MASIATAQRRRNRWVPMLVAILALCGCGKDSTTDAGSPAGSSVSADIGPAGGTLEMTIADGVAYKLIVPPGALPAVTRITMSPAADDSVAGALGALSKGVSLGPEGTVFDLRATMTATFPGDLSAAGAPAILHRAGVDPAMLVAAAVDGRTLSVPIEHFSRTAPVSPSAAQMEVYWGSILLEIDTYGVNVGRVRALVGIYLHALSNSAVYPTIDLAGWEAEIRAQTNDLIILGSLRCSSGAFRDGEYILNSARNIASIMFFADLEAEALEAVRNVCNPGGACPNAACPTTGYGEPRIYLSLLGVVSEYAVCGVLADSYSAGTESGNGIVGYGSARHTAYHNVTGEAHGGFSSSSNWDDLLIVTGSDPGLAGTWGYMTARIKVTFDGAAETRDGSETTALSIAEARSGDLKLLTGGDFDIRSWNTDDGLHSGIASGTYVYDVKFEFQFGTPRYLRMQAYATATWIGSYGQLCNGTVRTTTACQWLGITGVYTSGGAAVAGYTVCARSGSDYTVAAPER